MKDNVKTKLVTMMMVVCTSVCTMNYIQSAKRGLDEECDTPNKRYRSEESYDTEGGNMEKGPGRKRKKGGDRREISSPIQALKQRVRKHILKALMRVIADELSLSIGRIKKMINTHTVDPEHSSEWDVQDMFNQISGRLTSGRMRNEEDSRMSEEEVDIIQEALGSIQNWGEDRIHRGNLHKMIRLLMEVMGGQDCIKEGLGLMQRFKEAMQLKQELHTGADLHHARKVRKAMCMDNEIDIDTDTDTDTDVNTKTNVSPNINPRNANRGTSNFNPTNRITNDSGATGNNNEVKIYVQGMPPSQMPNGKMPEV